MINRYKKRLLTKYNIGSKIVEVVCLCNGLSRSATLADRSYYDLDSEKINLSHDVYFYGNLWSVAVAAHECGHAVQKSRGYWALRLYSAFLPSLQMISGCSFFLLLFGLIDLVFGTNAGMLQAGGILYGYMALFSLLSLPIEVNASHIALESLVKCQLVNQEEAKIMKEALYLAAGLYFLRFLLSPVVYSVSLIRTAIFSK